MSNLNADVPAVTAVPAVVQEPRDKNRAALRRMFYGRVLRSLSVGFWVSVIAFLMIRLSPGDPVQIALGAEATPEMVKQMRTDLGLDTSKT